MKKIVSHIVCMALLALLCFGTVACGKKVGGGSDHFDIHLNVTELSLTAGDEYRLYTDDGKQYDTYVSSDKSVCSVTSTGIVRAVKQGKANVQVSANGKTLTCAVTVAAGEGGGSTGPDNPDEPQESTPATFLGVEMTADNLLCRAPDYAQNGHVCGSLLITDGYKEQMKRADGSQYAVCMRVAAYTYVCVWYDLLLPDIDLSDRYVAFDWEIYSSIPVTLNRIGNALSVKLQKGWNTVRLSWDQLCSASDPYLFTGVGYFPAGGELAIGSLTPKTFDEVDCSSTFADTPMTPENLKATNGTVEYVSKGNTLDTGMMAVKGLEFTAAANAELSYADLLPETDYDYAVWRLYNGTATPQTVAIGRKEVTLYRGWNSVKLDWANLDVANGARIAFPAAGTYGIGAMTAGNYSTDPFVSVPFMGLGATADTLLPTRPNAIHEAYGSLTVTNSHSGVVSLEGNAPYVVYNPGAQWSICLWYLYMLPDEPKAGAEYEWKIFIAEDQRASANFQIGGKTGIKLKAGWNTVHLTSEELYCAVNTRYAFLSGWGDIAPLMAFGPLTEVTGA